MEIRPTALDGVMILDARSFPDRRGWFRMTYGRDALAAAGIDFPVVQDNLSLSRRRFTIRGLHFQRPPVAQPKIVHVLAGAVLDIALDIRPGSASFGRHVAVRLDAGAGRQLLIPAGFAHGFCTLEDNTLVQYRCAAPYAPEHEDGILWHDPDLGIAWPVGPDAAVVSDRDRSLPRLCDVDLPDW